MDATYVVTEKPVIATFFQKQIKSFYIWMLGLCEETFSPFE